MTHHPLTCSRVLARVLAAALPLLALTAPAPSSAAPASRPDRPPGVGPVFDLIPTLEHSTRQALRTFVGRIQGSRAFVAVVIGRGGGRGGHL
jgi:hypothetical protein